jgi:hypothetical protein
MHPAILGIALGTQLMLTPVSDQVPKLDVAATCKATVQTDKSMGLDLPQTYEKCMADEADLVVVFRIDPASMPWRSGGGRHSELCRSARLSSDE